MMRVGWLIVGSLAGAVLLGGGCAPAPREFLGETAAKPILTWSQGEKRLVLVCPDIKLGLVTTGGLIEIEADWSRAAHDRLVSEIVRLTASRGVKALLLADPSDPHEGQLVRLYESLVAGPDGPGTRAYLRRKTNLDDSLGPGTRSLAARYGADYGLFFTLDDIYTSTGRVVANVAAGLVVTALSGGRKMTSYSDASRSVFISLVDLRNGQIVWTHASATDKGDLREEEGLTRYVESELREMPL